MQEEKKDYVYQYTSLSNLALILEHNTIRFTRTDLVNDPDDKNHENSDLCSYISCWTNDAQESIPMWSMYGKQFEGVRFGMPKIMFKDALKELYFYEVLNKNKGNIAEDEFNQNSKGLYTEFITAEFKLKDLGAKTVKMIKSGISDNSKALEDNIRSGSMQEVLNLIQEIESNFQNEASKLLKHLPKDLEYLAIFSSGKVYYSDLIKESNNERTNFYESILKKTNWQYEDEYRYIYAPLRIMKLFYEHAKDDKHDQDPRKQKILEKLELYLDLLKMPKHIDIKFKLPENQKIDIIYGAKMSAGDKALLNLLHEKYEAKTTKPEESKIKIT